MDSPRHAYLRHDNSALPWHCVAHTGPTLYYDGNCGLCARSVQWVLAHERQRADLVFLPLAGPSADALRARHPDLGAIDSLIWQGGGNGAGQRVRAKSAAVLEVLHYIGGGWRLIAWLGALVPRAWRDAVYDLIARHRHGLADSEHCLLPTAQQRRRFPELPPAC
jgi:predicted DCC family thiol-disulfide oxidoreductase YuxK